MAKQIGTQSDRPFVKLFQKLTYRFSPWEVWKDFVSMFACAISNSVDKNHFDEREALYLKTIQKHNKEEQAIFPQLAAEVIMALEENPEQDFLGKLFTELNLSNESGGQFFTPYDVCVCMAKITIDNITPQIEERGYITINDSACGAGATLIAGIHAVREQLDGKYNWQNHLLITAQDIDYTVALMCYIQLSLLGAAGYIKVGDTLADPMCSNDSLENYWFTPIYFRTIWVFRQLIKGRKLL